MSDKIVFDKEDVQVKEIPPLYCIECSPDGEGADGSDPKLATHYVSVDFRSAGIEAAISERDGYCEECATELCERIRESLPECKEESDGNK